VVGQERFAYFCALSKVSRRKGGTIGDHHRSNGYAHSPDTSNLKKCVDTYAQYAQPGLVAYSAGKMAQLGIMNALSGEGAAVGILVNAISPVAKTRMWGVNAEPDNLKPAWVTPGVLFLASELCQDSGYILRASNGQFTATRFSENPGVEYPLDLARVVASSAEQVAAAWSEIKEH